MERFSTARTAQIIDISTQTLRRWYKWYNDPNYKKPQGLKLPKPVTDHQQIMYFTMKQVQELAQFKEDLQGKYRGCMSEFNAVYQWGKRGTAILTNKIKKGEKHE